MAEFEDLKPPVGQFILDSGAKPVQTEYGALYHYTDVCTLAKRYARKMLDEYSEKVCNQLNDAGLHQAEHLVIEIPYPL